MSAAPHLLTDDNEPAPAFEETPPLEETPLQDLTADFEACWHAVRKQIWMWCLRAADNEADAQDLFQQVAIRAWRGYATFRGEATFLTWTLAIARRVAAYQLGQRGARRKKELSLEIMQANAPAALPPVESPALPVAPHWLPDAVQAAHAADELADNEAAVLMLRLRMPDAGWNRIGALLNLSETGCAVLHCRAVPKLRVFLFQQRQDILGGADEIAAAFKRAREGPNDPLSSEEVQVFRCLILEKQTGYRKSGWRSALRTACEKVIRYMGVML